MTFFGSLGTAALTASPFVAIAAVIIAVIRNGPRIKELANQRESGMVAALTKRVDDLQAEVRDLHAQLMLVAGTLVDVIGELPDGSPARVRAHSALRVAFPLNRGVPDDIAELAERLIRKG